MAGDPDRLGDSFETENTGGLLSGFLAEEEDFDRRSLWRLGSWGVASVAAVIVAVLANQSSIGWRRDQVASADLARQTQQIQFVARESQTETRRLASAIDTLNGDRDRLYSRVTSLEQGLDSVTGSISRQNSAASPQTTPSPQAAPAPSAAAEPAPQNPPPAPVVAAVSTAATVASVEPAKPATPATTPAIPLMASKSMMAPPDAAAGKLIEPEVPASVVSAAPMPEVVGSLAAADRAAPDDGPATSIQRTQFAVDVGSANSLGGLRALWRGLLKSNSEFAALRPLIMVKERNNGLGMQLRLVAGPLGDAAAAAKICAALIEGDRPCETTVFDGQRLAMRADEPAASGKPAAAAPKPVRRRTVARRTENVAEPKKPEVSTLSSLFSRR